MYYVVYGLLWLISLLPLRLLYILSDGFYGLIFYVFRYRRDVVIKNLTIAFPEKSDKERWDIAKKFYHNLIDLFVEMIKMLSISDQGLEKRFTANWELINAMHESGRSIQLHVGHNFNWEWGNMIMGKKTVYKLLAVYMPLENKVMEKLVYNLRTKKGAVFLRATHIKDDFLIYRHTQYLFGLVADQNPGSPYNAWWINFFNRPTPFAKGPAKTAKLNDTEVIFAFIHKPRRGYYEAVFSPAVKNVKSLTEQDLTQKFAYFLEDVIRKYPDMWLWSHRRWKHEWKPEYESLWIDESPVPDLIREN